MVFEWRHMLPYERAATVHELLSMMHRTPLFERDTIDVIDCCCFEAASGVDLEAFDGLRIHGKASANRRALYDRMELNLQAKIAAVAFDVVFGIDVGDALPPVLVRDLSVSPPGTRRFEARRRWSKVSRGVALKAHRHVSAHLHEALEACGVSLQALAGNVPAVFVFWASSSPSSIAFLRQHIFEVTKGEADPLETFARHHLQESAAGAGDASASSVPVEAAAAVTIQEAVQQAPRLKSVLEMVVPHLSLVHHKTDRGLRARGERRTASIVLVSLDSDEERAQGCLRGMARRWPQSSTVDLSSVWAGPEGALSETACVMGLCELPVVVAAASKGPMQLPVVVSRRDLAPQPTARGPSGAVSQPHWRLDATEWIAAAVREIAAVVSNADGALALRWERSSRYSSALTTAVPHERAADALAHCRTELVLSGTCFSSVLEPVRAQIERLHQHRETTGFAFRVMCLEPSAPLVMPIDRRCTHCGDADGGVGGDVFFCLECTGVVLCERCATSGHHDRSHVLARCPAGRLGPQPVPVLWGRTNTKPLPTTHGALIVSRSGCHVGAFCHHCLEHIVGVRWRCLECFDVDFCDGCCRCDAVIGAPSTDLYADDTRGATVPYRPRHHRPHHILARIGSAVPGTIDPFLQFNAVHFI